MIKEKFIEELSKELYMSKNMLTKYITIVGTNKENIKDYAENSSFAIVRKDNGFNVDYTAVMLNNKDIIIKQLQQENEKLEEEIQTLRKTLARISNEKDCIVDRQNIDYLSFATQLRHEICEEIRDKCVYVAGTKRLCENTSISTYNLNEILNQIEGEK